MEEQTTPIDMHYSQDRADVWRRHHRANRLAVSFLVWMALIALIVQVSMWNWLAGVVAGLLLVPGLIYSVSSQLLAFKRGDALRSPGQLAVDFALSGILGLVLVPTLLPGVYLAFDRTINPVAREEMSLTLSWFVTPMWGQRDYLSELTGLWCTLAPAFTPLTIVWCCSLLLVCLGIFVVLLRLRKKD